MAGLALEGSYWPTAWARRKPKIRRWSDPKTWHGKVPGPKSVAMVHGRVLLDRNASVREVHIMPGAELIFERRRNRTLQTTGNVLVHGKLTMAPQHGRHHRLAFIGVHESAFVGGGMDPLPSDVGLWVMDGGVLDIAGSPKKAWTRTEGGIAKGARRIRLQDDPVGWAVGDSLVLTPTVSPMDKSFHYAYDYATIKAINGRTVELSAPAGFPHPAVEVKPGSVYGPEVLNMSRTVQIEGAPEGRSHVFIHSSQPQQIRYAAIRHMGPQKPDALGTHFVPGRYGLHFHHCEDGSRGSLVEGVTISQCGAHAFVPHMSHGVTFRDCISHETSADAYWYDPPDDTQSSFSHDTRYDRCVASQVSGQGAQLNGYRLTGFFLGAGGGNQARGCVAVGVGGYSHSSGFEWPEQSQGLWLFEDSIAHNNVLNGIFAWQNTFSVPHEINRFTAYHNGRAGIEHGAYVNRYHYNDCALYGNMAGALILSAVSRRSEPIVLRNMTLDGAGLTDYVVADRHHNLASTIATRFEGCHFKGFKHSAIRMESGPIPSWLDFTDCTYEGNEYWVETSAPIGTRLRVRDSQRGELTVRRWDQPGIPRPEWNGSVTSGWDPAGA